MTNEVTVITGASSGIGAALAKQLGSKGHQLVLAARREKELEEVAKQAGKRALVVVTDVTRRGDVERLRSRALQEYGHVDVWVNNAGRGITKSVMDLTAEEVASKISSLIEHPVAELYTNPAMAELASRCYRDVAKFEENMARRTASG